MQLRTVGAAALAALLLALPARADEISGPGRPSLAAESWGGLFYVPSDLKDYAYVPGQGVRTITSPLGKVVIHDSAIGAYAIEYPQGKLSVEGTSSSANVSFFGQSYSFTRQPDGEFVIKTPDDEIHYKVTGSALVISGRQDTISIQQKDGDYHIESKKSGAYSYTPTPEGGFTVKGGPLVRFPYLLRGAVFTSAGVGVFIDFKKLDTQNPLFKFIEWQPALVFQK